MARLHNIQKWGISTCPKCSHVAGFVFEGDQVTYDEGCYCVLVESIRPSSWEEVARLYNICGSPRELKSIDAFWRFIGWPAWIAVEYQLPPVRQQVLAAGPGLAELIGGVDQAIWMWDGEWWSEGGTELAWGTARVTHWMPLPPDPVR